MAGETEGQEPRAAPATRVDTGAAALALGGAKRWAAPFRLLRERAAASCAMLRALATDSA
jgi:hypothetical protein